MKLILLVFATAALAAWIFLLCSAGRQEWVSAAFGKILDNMLTIDKLRAKDAKNAERLEACRGLERTVMGLFLSSNSEKKLAKLLAQNDAIQHGNMRGVSLLVLPGYAAQRLFPKLKLGALHKSLYEKNAELYGKKYAGKRAETLLAKLISYPMLAIPAVFAFGAAVLTASGTTQGLAVIGIGFALVVVYAYALFDEVNDKLKKRRAAIARQFPNVVSKLALLVTSGMIMDKAWIETSRSRSDELYMEMRKTADELDNLVEPVEAYSNFIDRCNTKETTKLASAIIQNLTKGNAEIGRLLKDMAHEAWQERRHTAKKDSEAANSKLMIPTMLLFIAILVMIMAPVVVNFNSLM